MDNLLSSVIDKASETLLQLKVSKTLPELPDSSEVTGNMDNVFSENEPEKPENMEDSKWEEYKEKMKKKREEAKKSMTEGINKAVEDQKNAIKNAVSNNIQGFKEIKSDLTDLGTCAGLLTVGSAEFATRIALVPPAIISATPMGPGVSAQLVPPLIKSLKGEGDNLSKVYDDCSSKMDKLGLNDVLSESSSRSASKFGIDISPISTILSVVGGAMSLAKPLILMVGSSVGGESGTPPEVEPPISIEYNAEDCSNFIYITPPIDPETPGDISPENCNKFTPMTEGSERKCDNCKFFSKKQ